MRSARKSEKLPVPKPRAPYRRSPGTLAPWLRQAEKDFALLGQVEKIIERPSDVMAAMVRCDPNEYLQLAPKLADLVARSIAIADAATAAHRAVLSALKAK